MKLSHAFALLTAPLLAYAGCAFDIHQTANWPEWGLWRVQIDVKAWSEFDHPDEPIMLQNFCNTFNCT
jgi:hypothetical protein